jgi:hypothetical protein
MKIYEAIYEVLCEADYEVSSPMGFIQDCSSLSGRGPFSADPITSTTYNQILYLSVPCKPF